MAPRRDPAGAVFTPLGPSTTNVTLATLLEPALWILVAPDRLGVLHDLTATLTAMKATNRLPDAIVLSQSPPTDRSTGTNAAELSQLGIATISTVVPRGGTFSESAVRQLLLKANTRNP